MEKIIGKKMKMDQIWKDDEAMGITPIQLDAKADLSTLKVGDIVKISGITKGHGFQGVVKRHGFRGGPKSHGQKNRLRAPGSIGSTAPQRVVPGRRMAGHMGVDRVTVKNLKIADLNNDNKVVFLRGSVPGTIGSPIEIVAPK